MGEACIPAPKAACEMAAGFGTPTHFCQLCALALQFEFLTLVEERNQH